LREALVGLNYLALRREYLTTMMTLLLNRERHMAQQTQNIWQRFDNLAALAETPDVKLIIAAIRLHAELTNLRLAPLPHIIGPARR